MAESRKSLIDRITSLFKRAEPESIPVTSERRQTSWSDVRLFKLDEDRLSHYKDYSDMDDDIVELSSSLDVHADFAVSGTTESELYSCVVDEKSAGTKLNAINDAIAGLEKRTGLKDKVWFIVRKIVKYGDCFYEIVCSPQSIVKLKPLPAETMYINTEDGIVNKEKPFYQVNEFGKPEVEFAPWEIVHFKIGDELYGYKHSMLKRLRRTYRVLRMLEDTLVVTRVVRANQRGVYEIDVTGMSEREATRYIRKIQLINRRMPYFDSDGKLRYGDDPLKPQEDIYVPVRKGGVSSFRVIEGDQNLGEITDVEHFHNKLFAGTKVPKAFLGFERDVNAKATLVQQNIAFAREVRRHRLSLIEGLKKIYMLEFLLAGVDPFSFAWRFKFPPLGDPDEKVRWEIEELKASTLKLYSDMGVSIPTEWIIRNLFLNLSAEEADSLLDMMGASSEEEEKKIDKIKLDNLKKLVLSDPETRSQVEKVEKAIKEALSNDGYDYYIVNE